MRFLRHDLHALSGAYALDALEPGAERDRFTRHLDRCPSCASEVRGFREVATAMAFAATTEPPPVLRDRVLAAAARTRQLPPEIRTHARPTRTRVPWVPWLSGVVATASIVVAVLFGFAQAHTRDELNQVRAENQAISLLLPALPPGKVYQLWLIGKPAITSAGLLPPAKDGRTPPVLATGVVKGDTLGLTVEPAGGSAQPTTKPILALPLPV